MHKTIPSIFMRFPEGRAKTLTFSYDDGMLNDVRLVDILDKYNLKATFNISTGKYTPEDNEYRENSIWNYMKKSDTTKLFKGSAHEVAIHGYSHPHLTTLPNAAIAHEVLLDKEILEDQFETIIRGMAYPKGAYDDRTVEVLKSCGVAYARTVHSTERFDMPTDWLRLRATCHHNNARLMELATKFTEMKVLEKPQMFYLWGHTYEFYENDNWNVIEEFAEFMSGRDDIWYATNIEIFEYVEDYEKLIFSADCTMVKNPTARKLWFALNQRIVSVEPGETKKIR